MVLKIAPEAINSKRLSVRYLKELKELSRINRNHPTPAESKIWNEILKENKTGFCFLRQKPIGRFILDFYCPKMYLAIEIDGNSHDHKKWYDQSRDNYLNAIGITTLRFTNQQITDEIDIVKTKIVFSLVKGRSKEGLSAL